MKQKNKMSHKKTSNKKTDNHYDLSQYVGQLINSCEQYADTKRIEHRRAIEYYNGEMNDLIAEEGRSQSVSRDVRAIFKKIIPSVIRTLLANDKIVEYQPASPGDEEAAEQATDFVNHVIVPESGAEKAIYDSVFDALLLNTGILKWSAYKKTHTKVFDFTKQSPEALFGLEGEDGIEVTDQSVNTDEDGNKTHDFKVKKTENKVDVRLQAIHPDAFLIHPSATCIEDSPIVGERQIVTRSELVSRGFNKNLIDELDVADATQKIIDDEEYQDSSQMETATEEVVVYEVYVRLDQDNDGIAELYRICCANQDGTKILSQEAVDEAPYAQVVAERQAHKFDGHSLAEDVMDIQRIKTALLRETLDNIYWQNKKQPAVDPAKLTESGLEAVYNPAFGKPIVLKHGANINEAIQWMDVPFVGDKSFSMMNYLDDTAKERTGITDQSAGLNPEAFVGMTATSAQIIADKGLAQSEMIIRSLARGGIKKAFRGLLKTVIAHGDKPRTMRLRGKWVEYDPRHWNVDMDCIVNVGLGAGSRERDLTVLEMIYKLQKELFGAIGVDNPYVKPGQLYNVLEKITEAAGLPTSEPYFTKPTEESIAALVSANNQPTQAEKKIQAQIELERLKAEAKAYIERVQMEADIRVKQAELELKSHVESMKAEQNRELAILKGEIDLIKHRETLSLKRQAQEVRNV